MIRVLGIDANGTPRDIGIEQGTVESIREQLEQVNFNIIHIAEEQG